MFFKKLKTELTYDPAILLLGKYPEKTIIGKDICSPMFTATLFTQARTWKQPKCPSTEKMDKEDVDIRWNITQPEKEQNNTVCSNMDGHRDCHTEESNTDII